VWRCCGQIGVWAVERRGRLTGEPFYRSALPIAVLQWWSILSISREFDIKILSEYWVHFRTCLLLLNSVHDFTHISQSLIQDGLTHQQNQASQECCNLHAPVRFWKGLLGLLLRKDPFFRCQNSITLGEKYEWGRIAKLREWHEGQWGSKHNKGQEKD